MPRFQDCVFENGKLYCWNEDYTDVLSFKVGESTRDVNIPRSVAVKLADKKARRIAPTQYDEDQE